MDRSGIVEIYSPNNPGKLVWDETFTLDASTQQHIRWACEEARKLDFLARDTNDMSKKKVDCWTDDWTTWLIQNNLTFPGSSESFKEFVDSETTLKNKVVTTMRKK